MKAMIQPGLLITLIAAVISAGLAFGGLTMVDPEAQITVHWGIDGPDRFVDGQDAWPYFWMFPGIVLVLGAVLALAPYIDPLRENLVRSRKAYIATWVIGVAIVVFVQAAFIAAAVGMVSAESGFARWILAIVSGSFIVIGNYMPKTRPNFLMGIRTPWTLTSATAWEKTHRLGGLLFILAGLAGLLCAFTLDVRAAALALSVILVSVAIVLAVYSWLVWKKSDDRVRPSDFIS